MVVNTNGQEKITGKLEYPDTPIDKHFSIFLVAIHHGLTWKTCWKEKKRARQCRLLIDHGWLPHPCTQAGCRRFVPQAVFTPAAQTSFFGELPETDEKDIPEQQPVLTPEFIASRLDPLQGQLSEPLLLTLDGKRFSGDWKIFDRKKNKYDFRLEWVDLHLFTDGTGILAFKTTLPHTHCSISDLSAFHRTLRDFSDIMPWHKTTEREVPNQGDDFWKEIIGSAWLGDGEAVGIQPGNDDGRARIFQSNQNYAKTLIFAGLTVSEEDDRLWNTPLTDPEIPYNGLTSETGARKWDISSIGTQQAIMEGYPTLKDLFAFELGTVSDCGASMGWHETGRGYQYSLEYIRRMVNENSVEIWEYWTAIALRDTCTFASFDSSMPIHRQAESWYYPLYVATYYLRLRLERLRVDIIDYDMADVHRGDSLKHEFAKFRNHFWFNELTTNFVSKEIYARIKNGMDVDDLFDKVSSEVDEVSAHLRQSWEKSSRIMLSVLVFLLPWLNSHVWPWISRHIIIDLLIFLFLIGVGWLVWNQARTKIITLIHGIKRRLLITAGRLRNLDILS